MEGFWRFVLQLGFVSIISVNSLHVIRALSVSKFELNANFLICIGWSGICHCKEMPLNKCYFVPVHHRG